MKQTPEQKRENAKRFYQNNKARLKVKQKEYSSLPENKARKKANAKEYYQKNKERIKARRNEHYSLPENKAKAKEYLSRPETKERIKAYREKNIERIHTRAKEHSSRPEVRVRIQAYERNKKRTDKQFALKTRLRTALLHAFEKFSQTGKLYSSRSYDIDFNAIIEYLKPFPEDLSNYQIDHIIPLSWFDFDNPQEVTWAFAPENHQWLTIEENLSKGNRYIMIKER